MPALAPLRSLPFAALAALALVSARLMPDGELLSAIKATQASDGSAIDTLFRESGCKHAYLDVGTNQGVQIRKLFEPQRYPMAKVLPIFKSAFGAAGLGCSVCAIGFEPNPALQERLDHLTKRYQAVGAPVLILRGAASTFDGRLTFSGFTDPKGVLAGSTFGARAAASTVAVRAIDLARVLQRVMRHLDAKARVVMKLDIEGSEYNVLLALLTSELVCHVDELLVEWHPKKCTVCPGLADAARASLHQLKSRRTDCMTRFRAFDNEIYWNDSQPWPVPGDSVCAGGHSGNVSGQPAATNPNACGRPGAVVDASMAAVFAGKMTAAAAAAFFNANSPRHQWTQLQERCSKCQTALQRRFVSPSPTQCAARLSTSRGFIIGRMGSTETIACVQIRVQRGAPSKHLGQLSGVYCDPSRPCQANWDNFANKYIEAVLASDMLQVVLPQCHHTATFEHQIGLPKNVPLFTYWSDDMLNWLELLQSFARRRTPLFVVTPFNASVWRNIGSLDRIHPSHNLAGLNVVDVLRVPQTFTWAPETMGAAADWSSMLELLRNDGAWMRLPHGTVVLLGCGAYGMPLALHAKQLRNLSSMYVGGLLQTLFGIRGGRWEGVNSTRPFINSHWTRPLASETPGSEEGRQSVDRSSYWSG